MSGVLGARDGPTNLQVMHINRADGKNIEMSVDNLTYVHSEDIVDGECDFFLELFNC